MKPTVRIPLLLFAVAAIGVLVWFAMSQPLCTGADVHSRMPDFDIYFDRPWANTHTGHECDL